MKNGFMLVSDVQVAEGDYFASRVDDRIYVLSKDQLLILNTNLNVVDSRLNFWEKRIYSHSNAIYSEKNIIFANPFSSSILRFDTELRKLTVERDLNSK